MASLGTIFTVLVSFSNKVVSACAILLRIFSSENQNLTSSLARHVTHVNDFMTLSLHQHTKPDMVHNAKHM